MPFWIDLLLITAQNNRHFGILNGDTNDSVVWLLSEPTEHHCVEPMEAWELGQLIGGN